MCISTFRRPKGLAKLIGALESMDVPPDTEVTVVIVDNDADGLAVAPESIGTWATTVVVEPRSGIPFSRNRSVAEAGDVDAIVFFDDDEQPRRDCLVRLMSVWSETDADVVQGCSVPRFEQTPPDWVVRAGYFARSFERDGEPIPGYRARTSNVLVRRAVFDIADPPFDERLVRSGGSDSFLFRAADERGFSFVGAASAVVDEDVPASRVTAKWLVQRQYRTGWGRSFHLRSQKPSAVRKLKRALAGMKVMLLAPRSMWRARPGAVAMITAGRRNVAYGRGLIVGLVGRAPTEYASVHGE